MDYVEDTLILHHTVKGISKLFVVNNYVKKISGPDMDF